MQKPNEVAILRQRQVAELRNLLVTPGDQCFFLGRSCPDGLMCVTIVAGPKDSWVEVRASGYENDRRWAVAPRRKSLGNWREVVDKLTALGVWTLPDLQSSHRTLDGYWGGMLVYAIRQDSYHAFDVKGVPVPAGSGYEGIDQLFTAIVRANFGDPITRRQFLDESSGSAGGDASSPTGGP